MLPIKGRASKELFCCSSNSVGFWQITPWRVKYSKNLLHLTSAKRLAAAKQTLITSERGESSPSPNRLLIGWAWWNTQMLKKLINVVSAFLCLSVKTWRVQGAYYIIRQDNNSPFFMSKTAGPESYWMVGLTSAPEKVWKQTCCLFAGS